jgi:hypothetical protein
VLVKLFGLKYIQILTYFEKYSKIFFIKQKKEKKGVENQKEKKIDFQGLRGFIRRGEYIVSTIADDGTLWTCTVPAIPIFNFGTTKIFQAVENGYVEIKGKEKGDEFSFSIKGAKVEKIYDFYKKENEC